MAEGNNKKRQFVSLLNDTTFKYLWKSDRHRKWLEKVIFLKTNIDLSDYVLVDNELNTGNSNKDYRLDIVLKKDNYIVNIEVNQNPTEYSSIKNHTYLYRLAGNPYISGEDYKNIYVTQINFNNGYSKDNKDIKLSLYEFVDKKHDLLIEGIKDYEIYLGNCKETCYNKENLLENYLAMFTCESYEEMRAFAVNDKEALSIVDELEKLSQDKYFGALYDASIVQKKMENSAKNEGYRNGVADGIEQEKKEMAKSMLNKNIDISTIAECTGLTIEEIKRYNNQNDPE